IFSKILKFGGLALVVGEAQERKATTESVEQRLVLGKPDVRSAPSRAASRDVVVMIVGRSQPIVNNDGRTIVARAELDTEGCIGLREFHVKFSGLPSCLFAFEGCSFNFMGNRFSADPPRHPLSCACVADRDGLPFF